MTANFSQKFKIITTFINFPQVFAQFILIKFITKEKTMFSKHNLAGVAVATLVAFSLTACGDSSSKAEAFVKKEYPDAKILSFSEIQKEFGLKDKECLVDKGDVFTSTYHFAKMADGELVILYVMTDNKSGASRVSNKYTINDIKRRLSSCS